MITPEPMPFSSTLPLPSLIALMLTTLGRTLRATIWYALDTSVSGCLPRFSTANSYSASIFTAERRSTDISLPFLAREKTIPSTNTMLKTKKANSQSCWNWRPSTCSQGAPVFARCSTTLHCAADFSRARRQERTHWRDRDGDSVLDEETGSGWARLS